MSPTRILKSTLFLLMYLQRNAATSESQKVKLAMTYDLGDYGLLKTFNLAMNHSTVREEVDKPYIYPIDHSLGGKNAKLLREYFGNTSFHFLLDFTKIPQNTDTVREFVESYGIPTISTNHNSMRIWVNTRNSKAKGYLIVVTSPDFIAESVGKATAVFEPLRVLLSSPLGRFEGQLTIIVRKNENMDSDLIGQKFNFANPINGDKSPEDILNMYDVSKFAFVGSHVDTYKFVESVAQYKSNKGLLVDGKSQDIRKLSTEKTNLFTERFSWWSVSTIVDEIFVLPNCVNHSIHVNIRAASKIEDSIFQEYKTKNLTDLFVVDVIHNGIKSYLDMAKNGKWINRTGIDFDWRSRLQKLFQKNTNLLGKYDALENSSRILPSLKIEMECITPRETLKYGELEFDSNYHMYSLKEVLFQTVPIQYLHAINYIGVCIVVDNRFIFSRASLNASRAEQLASLGNYFGFARDIMETISTYSFAKMYFISEESRYGDLNKKTGKWSGGIGILQNGKADMILGLVDTKVPNLLDAIDVSIPFFYGDNNEPYGIGFMKHYNPIAVQEINSFLVHLQDARVPTLTKLRERWFPKQRNQHDA